MITADLILPSLQATSKKQAFQSIADATAPLFKGRPELLFNALLDRERIGSTGIGHGVAVPHIKVAGVSRMYGVLARLSKPVNFDAIDGQPVDIIFMLLAPEVSKTTEHLKMLAHISRFLKDEKTRASIRATDDHAALANLLVEWVKAQAA